MSTGYLKSGALIFTRTFKIFVHHMTDVAFPLLTVNYDQTLMREAAPMQS